MHLLCLLRLPYRKHAKWAIEKFEEIAHRNHVRVDYILPVGLAAHKSDLHAFLVELLEKAYANADMRVTRENIETALREDFNILEMGWLDKDSSRKLADGFDIKYLEKYRDIDIVLFSLFPVISFKDHKLESGEDAV